MDRGDKRSGSERGGQEPLEGGAGLPDFGPARFEEAVDRVAERVVVAEVRQLGDLAGRDDVVAGAGPLDAVVLWAVVFAEVRVELLQLKDRARRGLERGRIPRKTTAGASRPRGFDPAMRRPWYSKSKLSRLGPS